MLTEATQLDGMYQLQLPVNKEPESLISEKVSGDQWHVRLGHLHSKAVRDLASRNAISP